MTLQTLQVIGIQQFPNQVLLLFLYQLSFKLVGDNIDKTVRPRHMRVDHQAASLQYFYVYAVQDRISYQHLSNTARLIYPEDVDVNTFLGTYCSRFKCIDSKLQSIDGTHIGPLFATWLMSISILHISGLHICP